MCTSRFASLLMLIAVSTVGCDAGRRRNASSDVPPASGRTQERRANDRETRVEMRAERAGDRPADSAAGTGGAGAASANAPTLDSAAQATVDSIVAAIRACPRDGRWHPCSIERRLQQTGLRPVMDSSAPGIPGLAPSALAWRVGRQSLRVVLYADEAAARAAMAALDSARAAPRGDTSVVWEERVTLFRAANAVALYLGGTDRQVVRVTDALLGGPPQPE